MSDPKEQEKKNAEEEERRKSEDAESYDDYLTRVAEEGKDSAANGEDIDQWGKDHGFGDE